MKCRKICVGEGGLTRDAVSRFVLTVEEVEAENRNDKAS